MSAAPSTSSEPSTPRSTPAPGPAALVAAAASAGAGLVHAAAAGSHSGDTTLMWLFACTAVAQLGWAAWMVLRPTRWCALAGVALNGAAVAAWVATRTVGLVGPLADVEPVGQQDLLAAVLGAAAVGAAIVAAWAPRAREQHVGRGAGWVVAGACAVVLALAVPAMASEHAHHGGDHDHGSAQAHAHDDHAHTDAASEPADDHVHGDSHVHDDATSAADDGADDGPIVSLDDPRLTARQRRDATKLLTETRAALAHFPDEASVIAAGYRSIGDGRRVGAYEHFVKPEYLVDGRELDPDAIESIVLQRQADGTKKVVSAMYILERGKTMADVPDIAGSLTPWHDHRNLCFDDTGRLAGILRNGVCFPGGTLRVTPPMMHVWVDDPPCGPFTSIEGRDTGSCEHSHAA